MITEADDEGRLVADSAWLRIVIFPYHPRVTAIKVESALLEIASRRLIRLYVIDGVRYADFPSWNDHQRVNRPTESVYPEFEPSCEYSVNGHSVFTDTSVRIHSGSKEGRKEGTEGTEGAVEAGRGGSDTAPEGSGTTEVTPENGPARPPVTFRIPATVVSALDRAPILGQVQRLRDPSWWQAELRANPSVDLAVQVLRAEAWIKTNPQRAPRKDHAGFMHGWFARETRGR
jgi:hypothetical protein